MIYRGLVDKESGATLTVIEALKNSSQKKKVCYAVIKDGKALLIKDVTQEQLVRVYNKCWKTLTSID